MPSTEGLVLAAAGGIAGVLIAWWAVRSLVALGPPNIPRLTEIVLGWEALAFAALASVCVGLTCGLAASVTAGRPALRVAQTRPASSCVSMVLDM